MAKIMILVAAICFALIPYSGGSVVEAKLRSYDIPEELKQRPLFDEETGKQLEAKYAAKLQQTSNWNETHVPQSSCQQCKCGARQTVGRIVDGTNAQNNEFPWMILLATVDWFPTCGGSLITNSHAVTAAHCTRSVDHNNKVVLDREQDYRVVFNEHDRSKTNSDKFFLPIAQFIRHESYTESNSQDDIALIKFAGAVSFTTKLYPICLPSNSLITDGVQATVSGWGHLYKNAPEAPAILQKAVVPIISNEQCSQIYSARGFSKFVRPSIICAGNSLRTVCNGDSGGPMMINSAGRNYLAGIMSLSYCDATVMPSIYTRVSSYTGWILSKLSPESCMCN